MSQYTPATVRDILDWIEQGKLILPSMQRNYVWSPQKICDLFDSLASGYPIGTFLFWCVNKEKTKELVFNKFIGCYDESNPIQRGEAVIAKVDEYLAVLDGQQRITSLNIGINGRMHLRKKKRSTKFVDKFLALNVFHDTEATDGEATNHYVFEFREAADLEVIPRIGEDGPVDYDKPFWVSVNKIAAPDFDENDFVDELDEKLEAMGLATNPTSKRKKMRTQMKNVAFSINQTQAVSFHSAKNKDLAEVVDIFVRVNSGGQKLSASDLMLSIASGSSDVDTQRQISEAIELIRHTPKSDAEFPVDKELIIRAGLMFTGAESLSLSNKDNYSKEKIESIFVDNWDEIIESLQNGVKLLEWLGFNVAGLSKNLLLPVSYYLYKKNPNNSYFTVTSGKDSNDKLLIKQWVIRAIIRSIFRDGTGSTLIITRNIIDSSPIDHFPLGKFLEEDAARNLRIGEESIDEILRMSYSDSAVRPLLAVLSKQIDVTSFNVDHMWPQSIIASKKKTKRRYPNISDTEYSDFKKRVNNITNLQLLTAADNNMKSDKLYDSWLEETYSEASLPDYQTKACVDPNASTSFSSFLSFTEKRAAIMRTRIAEEFPDNIEDILFPGN